MNRKDMEALVKECPQETPDNTQLNEWMSWTMAAHRALTELLKQTRWRKTEEEPPEENRAIILAGAEGPMGVEDPFPGSYTSGKYWDWADDSIVTPTHWLPIPEVSE